jgi:glycosyltransferase involved in cell wall biosynthesis
MRLSIIIPAYNVEKYLERCIGSCEAQDITTDEYEIIVVNDGSADNTLALAHQLADYYSNVSVYTQENQGQSVARNVGIGKATGKYVWFVDADDYIEENCLATLLSEAENNDVDAYGFCMKLKNSESSDYEERKQMPLPLNQVMTGIYAAEHGFYPASVCTYLFRLDFLLKKELRFTAGITHQDVEFTNRAIPVADKVIYTEHAPYLYDYNPNSTSKSHDPIRRKKYILDDIRIAELIRTYALNQDNGKVKSLLIRRSNSIVCGTLLSMINDADKKEFLEDAVALAKEKGLYPMSHKMVTWKLSMLSYALNQEWLLKRRYDNKK